MMHDMVRQYYGKNNGPDEPRYKLSIEKDPLSCLIAMADILEEFGRPLAKYTVQADKVETRFDYPCNLTRVEVNGNVLGITYIYNSNSEKAANESRRKKEVEDYFCVSSGYVDLSEIGIERVTCTVKSE